MKIETGYETDDRIPEKISFILTLVFLFSINFSIALCYMVFSVLLISSSICFFNNGRKITFPPYFKYLVIFSILTFISTIFSIDRIASIKDNKELFVYLLVPVFILTIKRASMFRIAVYTVFYSAIVSSLFGIIISAREGISLTHRLKGFSSHWMTYSGLLMMVFVFFAVFNIYEKKRTLKILNFVLLIPILTSILLSLTRSTWIGIFISTGIFFVYYFRKQPKLLIGSALILSILFFLLPGSIKSRVFSIFDINNVTNKDRLHMAYTTLQIVKDHPLTGVGSDNVKKVYPEYRHKNATKNNPHLHNNFFQIAAERGILTLISFITFFVSIFIGLARKIRSGTVLEKRVSSAVLFMLISFLTAGMFEYNFGDTELKFLLLFFISLPYFNIYQVEN